MKKKAISSLVESHNYTLIDHNVKSTCLSYRLLLHLMTKTQPDVWLQHWNAYS